MKTLEHNHQGRSAFGASRKHDPATQSKTPKDGRCLRQLPFTCLKLDRKGLPCNHQRAYGAWTLFHLYISLISELNCSGFVLCFVDWSFLEFGSCHRIVIMPSQLLAYPYSLASVQPNVHRGIECSRSFIGIGISPSEDSFEPQPSLSRRVVSRTTTAITKLLPLTLMIFSKFLSFGDSDHHIL